MQKQAAPRSSHSISRRVGKGSTDNSPSPYVLYSEVKTTFAFLAERAAAAVHADQLNAGSN